MACAVHFIRNLEGDALDDPSRCPACHRDDLLRVEGSIRPPLIPLLHCRSCGEAYRLAEGTLIRDTGRPLF